VQGLPVFLEAYYEAYQPSLAYRSLLAIRNLGNRHCGRLAQGTRRIQISFCRYRYVHKVDGSYASGEHYTRCSGQIPIEYQLQIWCSKVGFN
jgi:hypothetical protein